MARIRSIKPEFFRHEVLQDLEIANPGKYPLMVFAGLWGHCDNKGRFEWKPRQLKLDILPFLPFDMAETLSVLAGAEMVRRYEVDGKVYGEIPTFEKHQRLSGKELTEGEKFPPNPNMNREATGKQQGSAGDVQESQEGKGKEEEGNGEKHAQDKPAPVSVPGLDMEAWNRWEKYRREIKKTIKPASVLAAQQQMAKLGEKQSEAVSHSIANGYQGLFEPKGAGPPRSGTGRQSAIDNYAAQAAAARGNGDGRGTAATRERDITGDCSRVA